MKPEKLTFQEVGSIIIGATIILSAIGVFQIWDQEKNSNESQNTNKNRQR